MDLSAEILEDRPRHPHSTHTHHAKKAHVYFRPENSIQWHEAPFLIILTLATVLFGIFAWNLPLLEPDISLMSQLRQSSVLELGANYIKQNGIHNPLGFVFSLGLLSLAELSVPLVHLLLYGIHAFTGVIVGFLFSRRYTRLESALFALLFLSFPFITPSYALLSNGHLTIGLFLIVLQIWIMQSDHIDYLVKAAVLMIVQTVGVLIDSRMMYTIIPILLPLVPRDQPLFSFQQLRTMVLLLIPTVLVLVTRWFTGTPATFAAEELTSLLQVSLAPTAASPAQFGFWTSYIAAGFQGLLAVPLSMLFLFCLLGGYLYEFVVLFQSKMARFQEDPSFMAPLFWIGLAIAAAASGAEPLIGLPLLAIVFGGFLTISWLSRRLAAVLLGFVTIITTLVTIGFLTHPEAAIMEYAHLRIEVTAVSLSRLPLPHGGLDRTGQQYSGDYSFQ